MRKLSILATLLMLVPFTLAQTPTGTIEGTVQDSSGASVAGATVTVTSSATGASKQLTSDAAGRFQLPFVAPGSYKVTVGANGFRSAEQNEIVVEVSQKRVLSFTLSVGKVSETVEVQATAPVLDTQTSSLGEVVQTRTITDLPLNGRNPFALATLVPTVVDDSGNAPIPHIGGGRDSTSEVQIDGMSNILPENNVGDNILAYRPIVDSVQEFSVQTNVLPAEYGRFSGGTISLVTRSGGEKYHGTGFLFARNGVLDALSYFSKPDSPKADTHQYQSGFTFGGPVPLLGHRKRTFFFFAYENSQASIAGQETDTLPLPEWYSGATAGDFSALIPAGTDCDATPVSGCIYDPLTVDPVTKKRLAFPGNIIPQARLNNPASQIAIKMLSFYPAPNANGNGFNYTVVGAAPTTYSHWDARIDHDFTKDWHSFLRVSHFDQHSLGGNSLSDYGDSNPASQGYGGPDHQNAWTAAFNNTVTFSPTLLGEFRYGVSRSAEKRTGAGGNFDPTTLGLPAYVGQTAGPQGQIFPRLNLSDGFSGLGPNGFNAFSQNPFAHDITGSIVKIAGSHAIKFGAEFRKIYSNFYQFGLPTGQYNLDRTWTQDVAQSTEDGTGTGNPFAGFLLGLAASGDTDHTPSAASSSGYFAAFIQDDWKVTRRLTVNLGLRYDFEIPKTERFDKLSYWDPTVASPLGSVTPAPGVNCPHCANLLGAMFFPGTTGKFGRRQGPTQYKDFGPRIGFAYDVGHGLVVRSGFGIVFAPSDLQAAGTSGGVGNQGFQSQTQFASSFDNQVTVHATIDDPYPADPTTGQRYNLPLGAAGGPLTQVGSGISDSFFSSYRNPYNIQWNFNVQYALPGQATLEVGYLGNHGLFLVDGDPGENVDQLPTSDLALGNALFTQVANPFFGVIHPRVPPQ